MSTSSTSSSLFASTSSVSVTGSSATDSTTTAPGGFNPSESPRPSGFGGGGGGGGGGGNNNQFASPAASNLYPTLVLLLLVSGAVVARSITLRVRARRAIEESIRNGTYVPLPRGLNGTNVPKPEFYDAHIKDAHSSPVVDEKQARWNQLLPVAASFIPSESPHPLPQPATSAPPSPRPALSARIRSLNPFRAVQVQDILDELASRDLHSRMVIQPDPQPTQAQLAASAFRTISAEDENADQQDLERPSAMRIAVLIAMPDPSRPMSNNYPGHDDVSSSASSAKGKSPIIGNASKSEDEAEMPYVEFGVAEVPFAPVIHQSSSSSSTPRNGMN
ncbi:hypothetical protein ACEPAI_4452 [Sanghuangporus weigelae]